MPSVVMTLREVRYFGYSVGHPGNPIGGGSYTDSVRVSGDNKYVKWDLETQLLAIGTLSWQMYPLPTLPTGATLDSFTASVRWTADSQAQSPRIVCWFSPNAGAFEMNTQYVDPLVVNPVSSEKEPDEVNWQTATVTLTGDSSPASFTIKNMQQDKFAFEFNTEPCGGRVWVDYVTVTINFTLPSPTSDPPVILKRWMNHFETSTILDVAENGTSSVYPLTYYLQWTDQDPTEGDPSVISSSGLATVWEREQTYGTDRSHFQHIHSLVPDDFAFTDHKTYLIPNKNYWIRMIVSNASASYTGSWTATSTRSSDEISI